MENPAQKDWRKFGERLSGVEVEISRDLVEAYRVER